MYMKLQTVKTVLQVLYALCLVLIAAGFVGIRFNLSTVFFAAAAVVMVILTIFRVKFWRCPKCGHMLDKGNATRCGFCKWELRL